MTVYRAIDKTTQPSHAHATPFTYAIIGFPPKGKPIAYTHTDELRETDVTTHDVTKYTVWMNIWKQSVTRARTSILCKAIAHRVIRMHFRERIKVILSQRPGQSLKMVGTACVECSTMPVTVYRQTPKKNTNICNLRSV
jgi:hypothetical protein